jgi:isopentenyl diphosphate isomerase/L-lactate dehydrogenase-like FMN-dependent dehydrogenase
VLPEIVSAVGAKLDIMMDGGVRRGTQIVKAMAFGAKAVLLGRAYAYGLGAAGDRGVARVIELLRTEVDVTIGHMGVAKVSELHRRKEELLRR